MPVSKLTSGERLGRKGQTQARIGRGEYSLANLIVIGASAGGLDALKEILSDLSADIPAAIIILIHAPLDTKSYLKHILGDFTRIPIVEVERSEPLRRAIFLLPSGTSASLNRGRIIIESEPIPREAGTPIDRLFTSAANAYRERVIGVILSGTLWDGTVGLRAVHQAGGLTIAQNPSEAEFSSMPASAMADLPVTFCLNLSDIGAALELLVRRGAQFETGLDFAIRTLRDRVRLLVRLAEQSGRNRGTHDFLVDELTLLNRDLRSIDDRVKSSVSKLKPATLRKALKSPAKS